MSRIAFFCIPAHGHTNPTLEVVRELIRQGHEVIYFSYSMLREKIESTGAKFIPCDEYDCEQNLKEEDRSRIGSDIAFSMKVLVDTTLALDEMVCRVLEERKVDCVVTDSMAVWGKAAAMKLGIPFVVSNTTFAFNKQSSQAMRPSLKELFSLIRDMKKGNREVKRLSSKGYPFKNVLDIISNDNKTDSIVYTSCEFQPFSETFSDKYVFVGPSIRPAEEVWEKTKEKLVYISMGTVDNDKVPFYKNCIEAFKDTDYQVVMSVGNLVELSTFDPLPENISVFESVDQIAVLEKADVFLSHCGMNSVNESLYFEVPLVTHPGTKEQLTVAVRAEELGAGVRLEEESPENIRRLVDEVINTERYHENASKISEGFKQCSGTKGAVKKIHTMCR